MNKEIIMRFENKEGPAGDFYDVDSDIEQFILVTRFLYFLMEVTDETF